MSGPSLIRIRGIAYEVFVEHFHTVHCTPGPTEVEVPVDAEDCWGGCHRATREAVSDFMQRLVEPAAGESRESGTDAPRGSVHTSLIPEFCPDCGPGYRYGYEGCRHTPPSRSARTEESPMSRPSQFLTDEVWVLRAACGCPWAATMSAWDADEAWAFAAGTKSPSAVAAMVAEGLRLEREPAEAAAEDVRARLGSCTHVSKEHAAALADGRSTS